MASSVKSESAPMPDDASVPKGGGGVFKHAALRVLRKERRLMSTGEVTRTAIRLGFIGQLPGKTPEATMASALYTDVKKFKAGKAGSLFCRPREGLFGLREWAGDSELCELVATEDGSADVKHPQVPTISPRRPRKRSFKRSVSAGTSSESDEAHDEDEFRSIKPRVSVESSDSEEAVVEAFAPSAPFVSATSDAPLSSAERGLRATGPFMPNWDDAGILLLLNAAEDIEVQERNGETSSKGGLAPEETEAEETTEGGKNATGKGMGVMGKSPGMTEATVDALSKKSAAVSGGNRKTAPPPPLSLQQQIISLILQQQQAQAQAREQPFMAHLDVVIQQLALRAGQLLATLGPHELTVQALMALAVACNSRGYVADTKLALNQLWDVVYARVFPGGMGVTDARLAELQIQFGAMVKRAMTDDSFLQGVC